MNIIKSFILDVVLPSFKTDWVALYENENGHLVTTMTMDAWDEHEDPVPAGVIKIKCFSWLGIGWAGKPCGDPMEYDEWLARSDNA